MALVAARSYIDAGVPLGIARAAIDAVIELASHKELMPDPHKLFNSRYLRDESRVHEAIAVAEGALAAARSFTYSSLEELWETLCRNEKPSPQRYKEPGHCGRSAKLQLSSNGTKPFSISKS